MAGTFMSFNFDDLPDYEPLEVVLGLMRSDSMDIVPLDKLLQMDTMDLEEHCQWPELLVLLSNCLCQQQVTNSSYETVLIKVMAVHIRLLLSLNLSQSIDIAVNMCRFIWPWVHYPPTSTAADNNQVCFDNILSHSSAVKQIFSNPIEIAKSRTEKTTDAVVASCCLCLACGHLTASSGTDVSLLQLLSLVDPAHEQIEYNIIDKSQIAITEGYCFISCLLRQGGVLASAFLSHAMRSGLLDVIHSQMHEIGEILTKLTSDANNDNNNDNKDLAEKKKFVYIYCREFFYVTRLWLNIVVPFRDNNNNYYNNVHKILLLNNRNNNDQQGQEQGQGQSLRWDGRLETQAHWGRDDAWGPLLCSDLKHNKLMWHLSSSSASCDSCDSYSDTSEMLSSSTSSTTSAERSSSGNNIDGNGRGNNINMTCSFICNVLRNIYQCKYFLCNDNTTTTIQWLELLDIVSLLLQVEEVVGNDGRSSSSSSLFQSDATTHSTIMSIIQEMDVLELQYSQNKDESTSPMCSIVLTRALETFAYMNDKILQINKLSCNNINNNNDNNNNYIHSWGKLLWQCHDRLKLLEIDSEYSLLCSVCSFPVTRKALCHEGLCPITGSHLLQAYTTGAIETVLLHHNPSTTVIEALLALCMEDMKDNAPSSNQSTATSTAATSSWLSSSTGGLSYREVMKAMRQGRHVWESVMSWHGDCGSGCDSSVPWLLRLPVGLAFMGRVEDAVRILDNSWGFLGHTSTHEDILKLQWAFIAKDDVKDASEASCSARNSSSVTEQELLPPVAISMGTIEGIVLSRVFRAGLNSLHHCINSHGINIINTSETASNHINTSPPSGFGLFEYYNLILNRRLSCLGTSYELRLPLLMPLSETELDTNQSLVTCEVSMPSSSMMLKKQSDEKHDVGEGMISDSLSSSSSSSSTMESLHLYDVVLSVDSMIMIFSKWLGDTNYLNMCKLPTNLYIFQNAIGIEYETEDISHGKNVYFERSGHLLNEYFDLNSFTNDCTKDSTYPMLHPDFKDGAYWMSSMCKLLFSQSVPSRTILFAYNSTMLVQLEGEIEKLLLCFDHGQISNIFRTAGCPLCVVVRSIIQQWFVNWLPLEDIALLTALSLERGHRQAVCAAAAIVVEIGHGLRDDVLGAFGGVEAIERVLFLCSDKLKLQNMKKIILELEGI
eukprot:gene4652-9231_t